MKKYSSKSKALIIADCVVIVVFYLLLFLPCYKVKIYSQIIDLLASNSSNSLFTMPLSMTLTVFLVPCVLQIVFEIIYSYQTTQLAFIISFVPPVFFYALTILMHSSSLAVSGGSEKRYSFSVYGWIAFCLMILNIILSFIIKKIKNRESEN